MDEQKPAPEKVDFQKVEDFIGAYANNVQFLPTAWDLKFIFGELNQVEGGTVVEQHTSITMSWQEVKIFSYYLQIQIASHEIQDGKIQLPERVLPPEPPPVSKEEEKNAQARLLREIALKIREQFLASMRDGA